MKLFDMGLKKHFWCCWNLNLNSIAAEILQPAGPSKNPPLLAIAAIAPRDHIFELRLVQGCHVINTQAASQSQIQLLVEVAVVPHGDFHFGTRTRPKSLDMCVCLYYIYNIWCVSIKFNMSESNADQIVCLVNIDPCSEPMPWHWDCNVRTVDPKRFRNFVGIWTETIQMFGVTWSYLAISMDVGKTYIYRSETYHTLSIATLKS